MPRQKDNDVEISDEEEDAAINAGIALDQDNPELDDDFFANARPFYEVFPQWRDESKIAKSARISAPRVKQVLAPV